MQISRPVSSLPHRASLLASARRNAARAGRAIWRAWDRWRDCGTDLLAASLAYYATLSAAPALLLVIRTVGWALGRDEARHQVLEQVRAFTGEETARVMRLTLEGLTRSGSGRLATVLATITLLVTAAKVFAVLREALNRIGGQQASPPASGKRRIGSWLLPYLMVLATGVVFVASLLTSAVLRTIERFFHGLLPGVSVFQALNAVVSFALIALLFAALYRVVPEVPFRRAGVWAGAVAASAMFALSRWALGLYFDWSLLGSAYAKAGSVIVVLLWLYALSIIVLLGAHFAQAWGRWQGLRHSAVTAGQAPAPEASHGPA